MGGRLRKNQEREANRDVNIMSLEEVCVTLTPEKVKVQILPLCTSSIFMDLHKHKKTNVVSLTCTCVVSPFFPPLCSAVKHLRKLYASPFNSECN